IHRTVGTGRLVIFEGYDPAGRLLLLTEPQSGASRPLSPEGTDFDLKVLDPETGKVVDELENALVAAWSGRKGVLVVTFSDGTAGTYDVERHARIGQGRGPGIRPVGALADHAHDRVVLWDNAGHVRTVSLDDGRPTAPTFDIPKTSPAPWAIGWRVVLTP